MMMFIPPSWTKSQTSVAFHIAITAPPSDSFHIGKGCDFIMVTAFCYASRHETHVFQATYNLLQRLVAIAIVRVRPLRTTFRLYNLA
jgi:hypothetical protein